MAPKKAEFKFVLPLLVTGPVEVGRLIRELDAIDGVIVQATLRQVSGGPASAELPRISQLMQKTTELNKLDLLQADARSQLANYLHTVRGQAPVLHISFSADPNADFIEKLMAWLRQEIHPQLLLTIGLEPNIGAGCIVRSTNKYFDFSLRQAFADKRDMLLGKLGPAPVIQPPAALTTPVPTPTTTHPQPTPTPEAVAA